jgi:hypothetical protein
VIAVLTDRPDAWNFPLFLHILGAMVLVGALLLAVTALANADGSVRLGYLTLLRAVVPAWIVMRVGAQWIANKEGYEDDAPTWVGIGFITSELGLLLIIIATVCAFLAVRRSAARGSGLHRASLILTGLLIVMYVVTIWAMTTKPS